MRAAALALLSLACAGESPSGTGTTEPETTLLPELDLPAVEALPEQDAPDPFVSWATGETVPVSGWAERRGELLVLFHHYVYGWSAAADPARLEQRAQVTANGARLVQLTGSYGPNGGTRRLTVAVWLPDGETRGIVLGLNKCGNPTVSAEPLLIDGGGWLQDDCDPGPGSRAAYWNIDAALEAGFGVATVHQSDAHPDDPTATDGMMAWDLPRAGEQDRWGAIGTWAHGLSRAVDLLDEETGGTPVIVMGHSRRGKAALWAAAQDERIDGVWAHQSGTGGAALSRHREGESIGAVNLLFPHWFDDVFPAFDGEEDRLPIDQHLLLALLAPRPLLVSDGEDDGWADPEGARQAVELAAPVFDALDGPSPSWTLRPGGHEVTAEDWVGALAWLEASW